MTGLAPGSYTVAATGPGVDHRQSVTASLPVQGTSARAAGGPIDLTPWARTAAPRDESSLSPYLIALALIAIGGEWIYWRRLRWRGVNARSSGAGSASRASLAVLGALAAVAALADLQAGSHAARAVLAVDRSASIDAAHARRRRRAGSTRANPTGACSPAASSASPRVPRRMPPTAVRSSPPRGATDLEPGVAAAIAAAPRGRSRRRAQRRRADRRATRRARSPRRARAA